MVKECTKCEENKPYNEYYVRSNGGMNSQCKQCCRDNTNKNTNSKIKRNRNGVYSKKYNVPNTIVYSFSGANGIAYIGSTDNGSFRIWEHYNDKVKSFCSEMSPLRRQISFKYDVLWHGDNYEDAQHQEKLAIQAHQPKFNIIKYKNYNG